MEEKSVWNHRNRRAINNVCPSDTKSGRATATNYALAAEPIGQGEAVARPLFGICVCPDLPNRLCRQCIIILLKPLIIAVFY